MNNVVYNEEKLIMIAENWNRLGEDGLAYESERLYRSKEDSYLLHVCTGSLCAETRGIKSEDTSKKIKLSKGQAYKWLEANYETEAIKELFNDKFEDV